MSCDKCDHSREGWGPGPWDEEPDCYQFSSHGLQCFMHRNQFGSWCGYVAVPPWHRCHGMGYDAVYEVVPDLVVHGGITYADAVNDILDFAHEGSWIFGFDCVHAYDYLPSISRAIQLRLAALDACCDHQDVYRDFYYVEEQVTGLARQLSLV